LNNTLIIAFGHKARRGKDTAVAHLIETFSTKYDIRRYAFGDELKREFNEEVWRTLGEVQDDPPGSMPESSKAEVAIRYLEDWAGVEHDWNMDMTDPRCPYGKPRYLLQWWGTEYRREGRVPGQLTPPTPDPFYWVRKMRDRIRADQPQIALISDMRFLNEAAMVKSEAISNRTVRIERLGFALPGEAAAHKSETELDTYGYDAEITVADGPDGLQELKRDVVWYVTEYLEQLSGKYSVAGSEVFAAPLTVEDTAVLLPNHTKPATYKIATPEGTKDATPEEFAEALRS
jgi:hypothetical protein